MSESETVIQLVGDTTIRVSGDPETIAAMLKDAHEAEALFVRFDTVGAKVAYVAPRQVASIQQAGSRRPQTF